MTPCEPTELFRKYRPNKLSEVAGQSEAIKMLKEFSNRDEFPHAMIFTGPSGTGKTTLSRIVAKRLGCSDLDYMEVNSANFRGIDDIRRMQQEVGACPMGGKCRVWYFDECHNWTSDSQDCLLKTLEEPPSHVYFILATTNPKKLKATILSRCTQIPCSLLSESDLVALVKRVVVFEDREVSDEVIAKIATVADGNGRNALVLLNSIIGLEDPIAQLAVIDRRDVSPGGFAIAQMLFSSSPNWTRVAELLGKVEEEPETVRRIILGYAKSVLLKSGSDRAYTVIEEFRAPLYDVGVPGLVASCFALCKGRK